MTLRKTFTIGQVWPEFVKRLPRMQPRYRIELGPNPFVGLGRALSDDEAKALSAQSLFNAQAYASYLYGHNYYTGLGNPLGGWPY